MFIRKKNINGKEYAYLVTNKYNKRKKQSRQKTAKYLGRVIDLGNFDRQTHASTPKEAIINQLLLIGFHRENNFLTKDNLSIDLNKSLVLEDNKKVCLQINEGFLCSYTLSNLLNFNSDNLTEKEIITGLANSLVSAGVNLHSTSFIEIYKKCFKT